jgi:putative endonuclease
MKQYFVYVMASQKNGTLYVGITDNIVRRVSEHKSGIGSVFVSRHKVTNLVYYEHTSSIDAAINREKRLKRWNREWKLQLIESVNPNWRDLTGELF